MKKLLFAWVVSVSTFLQAQPIIDDFSSSSIATNFWNVELPFGSSDVTQTNGRVTLVGRGNLSPKSIFAGGVEIKGRFRFISLNDHLRIVFRSNLENVAPYNEKTGMIVIFDQNGNVILGQSNGASISTTGYALPSNTDIDFRIWDDGNTVKVYVTDLNNPLLTLSSSHRTGNKVSFYNREFASCRTELDFLEIKDPNPALNIETASIRLRWLTESNVSYQVQYSTNFQTWSNLTNILGTGSETNLIEWTDSQQKYYRLIKN